MRRSAGPPSPTPDRLGCPFTCWSLTKLRDYLAEHKHIRLSREAIRQVLKDARISWQSTKTWKHSKDPEFTQKKDRILELYDHPPPDGRVLCVDEFGPLNLQPRPGKGWFPHKRPKRFRATYNRTGGVRHMFAALDLASGELFYRFRNRKRWREFLGFCKQLRPLHPLAPQARPTQTTLRHRIQDPPTRLPPSISLTRH